MFFSRVTLFRSHSPIYHTEKWFKYCKKSDKSSYRIFTKKCLTGENYKKCRIGQNQWSCKEYYFTCVNVESTFKLLLIRRFAETIDDSSPCFSAKSVAWVKKISAHHTSRVPRKALTSNLFSLFGYLSFRGLMRDLLGGLTCPRLISFGKVSLRLLGRALLASWTLMEMSHILS